MNLKVLPALTMDGTDQEVAIPVRYSLAINSTVEVDLKHAEGGDAIPIPANTWVTLGESVGSGQSIYLNAASGTVYLALQ